MNTIGERIADLRKKQGITQEQLAEKLNVSGQAVSKWENDLACPDIALLPDLADILQVSVDWLLRGDSMPKVRLLKENKDINTMMLKIIVDSADGDKVRVNLPLALVKMAVDMGVNLPQIAQNSSIQDIDLKQILDLVSQGVVGNLIEVESKEGDNVKIFVE